MANIVSKLTLHILLDMSSFSQLRPSQLVPTKFSLLSGRPKTVLKPLKLYGISRNTKALNDAKPTYVQYVMYIRCIPTDHLINEVICGYHRQKKDRQAIYVRKTYRKVWCKKSPSYGNENKQLVRVHNGKNVNFKYEYSINGTLGQYVERVSIE